MDKCTQSSIPLSFPPHISGPVYTERQSRRCKNSALVLVILLLLKTMALLKNGIATHFQVTPLLSMRTVSLVSSQSCRKDVTALTDAWCKRAFTAELSTSQNHVPPRHSNAQHTDLVRFVNLFFPRWEPSLPCNLCGNDSLWAFLFPTVVYCIVYVKEMANSV